jgi:NAD(P) transhydrogenase subunit alpha
VLREDRPGETRVAATQNTVARLRKLGYEVVVEPGAGVAADVVLGVNAPAGEQLDRVKPGATVIAILSPRLDDALVADLAARPVTALATDAVPRISQAQSMNVQSSMANIAGYRAVVEAAHVFGRFFTGQVTRLARCPRPRCSCAGPVSPASPRSASRAAWGAIVRATDPRPEVADQVRSLGGEYLSVESAEAQVSATGYAKEMSDDYNVRAEALYAETVP